MAKSPSSSSSSSSSEDVSQASGRRITSGVYNPCLILEAVKLIILKCLGVDHDFIKNQENQKQKEEASSSTNPQESCSTATDDHKQSADPPPSATSNPEDDPPTEDGADTTVSLAVPPRPGPSTGRGPRIN